MAKWSNMKVETAAERRRKRKERIKQEKLKKELEEKKRKRKIIIISSITIITIIILFIVLIKSFFSAKEEKVVKNLLSVEFKTQNGKIEIKKSDIDFFDDIDEETKIKAGDAIRTGKDSSVILEFKNFVNVKLYDNSELTIDSINLLEKGNIPKLDLNLKYNNGTITFIVPKNSGKCLVELSDFKIKMSDKKRTEFKIEKDKYPKKLSKYKPYRIVVKSGKLNITDSLGTKDVTLKTFQEIYIWSQNGIFKYTKPTTINLAGERF